MEWEKLGLIFNPIILKDKGLSAALMPIVELLDADKDIVRVYFCPRDEQNRSEVHYFDINIYKPFEILNISSKALLQHGKLGTFDDNGITLGSIVNANNKKTVFYTGWNLSVNVSMLNSIGIGVFNDDNTINRIGEGPIMTRSLLEPHSCASPFVLFENGIYKMWYAAIDKWEIENEVPKHFYNIKYSESIDGISWERNDIIAINYQNKEEYAFGRPHVIIEDGIYKMWYAYRGDYYKIGYAESFDGKNWIRKDDEAGITNSKYGWDSEMIEYPYIFDYKNDRFMFYNGNGYGKTGIGLAKLKPLKNE